MEKFKLEPLSDEPECLNDALTETMRKKASKESVPVEKFWKLKAKFTKEVQQRYSDEHYSSEWQHFKAQNLLWDYLFRPEPFPAKMPPIGYNSSPPKGPPPFAMPAAPEPPFATPVATKPAASKPQPLDFKSTPTYSSQMTAMQTNANFGGIDLSYFEKICSEKGKIAQNRFPAESVEWQMWLAESLIWVFFFKEAPFTGTEPSRLYPLRSSGGEYESTSTAADNKKGDKWRKTPLLEVQGGCGVNRLPLSYNSQSTLVLSSSSNAPQLLPGQYRTLEREMELKAISLNLRREFFVYLQGMRDRSRLEHRDCSSSYRAWFADSRTWANFFKNERFPGKEPVGVKDHSRECRHRQTISFPSKTSAPAPSRAVSTMLTTAFSAKPPSLFRSPPKVKPIDDEIPRDIMDKLAERNANSNPGREERVLMIDKTSHIYSKDDIYWTAASFSNIDHVAKAAAEKDLGCRLKCRLLPSGDAVLFCLPNVLGDELAVHRGIKFLKNWERKDYLERNAGRLLDFQQVSKEFNDSGCVVDSGLHSHQVLINGKAIRFSRSMINGICDSFSKDVDGRTKVEDSLKCRFSLVDPSQDHTFKVLKVTPLDSVRSPEARETVMKDGYKFLEDWVDKAYKTLVFEDMRALAISEYHMSHKETKTNGSADSARLLVVYRSGKSLIDCSDASLKSLSYNLLIDNQVAEVEKALQCKLILHERLRDVGSGLTIQLVPNSNAVPLVVTNKAAQLLLDWITQELKDEKLKLSVYWKKWSEANLLPLQASGVFKEIAACNSEANRELSPELRAAGPISLRNPEEEWEKYAQAFGSTDLDRVLMEEQVKVERKMRMVLDVDTQDMITLGEFETRTKLRCQMKAAGAVGIESGAGGCKKSTAPAMTSGDAKRKHDDADGDHAEKRTRL